MKTTVVKLYGEKWEVDYEFERGEERTYDYPGSSDIVEIYDIRPLESTFEDFDYEKAEELIIEQENR